MKGGNFSEVEAKTLLHHTVEGGRQSLTVTDDAEEGNGNVSNGANGEFYDDSSCTIGYCWREFIWYAQYMLPIILINAALLYVLARLVAA